MPCTASLSAANLVDFMTTTGGDLAIKTGASLLVSLKQAIVLLDHAITDPWRPEEIWVPIVYFICLRPLLWYSFLAMQYLKDFVANPPEVVKGLLKSKLPKPDVSLKLFKAGFFGFIYGPMYTLGIAFVVNWLCDTLVMIVHLADAELGSFVNMLGKLDTVIYIMVFGHFLMKLQDYYADDVMELIYGKHVDAGLVSFVHRLLEIAIVACTVYACCLNWGASEAVLAGISSLLGIGFGFASQEVLQNFFGGLMLVVMQPFQVGDNIYISNPVEGASEIIEGQVINIGYYQTILIDDNDHPIYVPNQWFVGVDIKNMSRNRAYFKERKMMKEAIDNKSKTNIPTELSTGAA